MVRLLSAMPVWQKIIAVFFLAVQRKTKNMTYFLSCFIYLISHGFFLQKKKELFPENSVSQFLFLFLILNYIDTGYPAI